MAEFVELTLEQGATFTTIFIVKEKDGTTKNLSSYTVRSQMRKSYYATTAKEFVLIKTDPAAGVLTMSMSAANTANLSPGRYVYDVELEDMGGVVIRSFEGIIVVTPGVTR